MNMKKILLVLGVLIVLVVVGIAAVLFVGYSQINTIAKQVIQRGGTYATQTETTVDTVEISPFDGTFAMRGFRIANPEGFDTAHFLAMNSTDVTLETGSLLSETIEIPSVALRNLDVILDKGAKPANYKQILNSLQRFESGEKPEAAPENKDGKKVVVDSLVLDEIDIRLANIPGVEIVSSEVAINIPRIELQDVGKGDPMTPAELVNLIIKTVMTAAIEAGAGVLPADVINELGKGLEGLASLSEMGITAVGDAGQIVGEQMDKVVSGAREQLGKMGEDASKAAGDATEKARDEVDKAVKDATDDVKKGIGNLLGGGDDDDGGDNDGP